MGQLPFFIQPLKREGHFDPWINDYPLTYFSNNAHQKADILGSLFLSILSGHKRYAHITTLISDSVDPALLGINKVISEISARRAVKKQKYKAIMAALDVNANTEGLLAHRC
jgi:hypothetical protein